MQAIDPAASAESADALEQFFGSIATGDLGFTDWKDASNLASIATRDPSVVSHALGEDYNPEYPPDATTLHNALMSEYANAAYWSIVDSASSFYANRKQRARNSIRSTMINALNLSDEDVARMDFDEANGDSAPWARAKEKFVFG